MTLTGLYDLILNKILLWEVDKKQLQTRLGRLINLQQDERYQSILPYLERLAFLGMRAKQIVLSAQLIYDAYDEDTRRKIDA